MEKIDTDIILPTLQIVSVTKKGRHYITPDGSVVPSVTNVQGILDKPALMWWAASVERDMVVEYAEKAYRTNPTSYDAFDKILRGMLPRQQARFRVSKQATDIGQETHALIQHRCKEMLGAKEPRPKVSEHAELAFMAWEEWAASVNFEPLLVEQTVWSERMKAAGTLDCYSIQDWPEPGERRHFVDDWKSSKRSKTAPTGIYPESLVQVATYAQMLVELGIAPDSTMGCIVRLPKSLEDPVFEEGGVVDHAEVMPETRIKYAKRFENLRKVWGDEKEAV